MVVNLLAQQATDAGIPWYAYILWAWVLVSLSVYGYRIYLRLTREKQSKDSADGSGATSTTGMSDDAGRSPSTATTLKESILGREPGPPPPAGTYDPKAVPLDDLLRPPDPTTTAPAGASGTLAEAPAGRGGLFAATPSADTAKPSDRARKTVAVLLAGVSMPCDLAPVMHHGSSLPDPMRVSMSTTTAAAPEIGRQVGDELERLGYTLRSLSDNQVEARRDDDALVVTIHVDPAGVLREGRPAFPTLPKGSVVVDFESA